MLPGTKTMAGRESGLAAPASLELTTKHQDSVKIGRRKPPIAPVDPTASSGVTGARDKDFQDW
jgi:hypothetical protein